MCGDGHSWLRARTVSGILPRSFVEGRSLRMLYDDWVALSECTGLQYRDQHSLDTENRGR